MTQDEIIEMANEAGLAFDSEEYPEIWGVYMDVGREEIVAFAKLVAEKEREACAKLCEAEGERIDASWVSCAAAIRARGQALAQPKQDGDCKKCKDGCPACDVRKIPNDLL